MGARAPHLWTGGRGQHALETQRGLGVALVSAAATAAFTGHQRSGAGTVGDGGADCWTYTIAVARRGEAPEAVEDVDGVGDAGLRLRRYTIGGTAVAFLYVMEVPRGEYSGIIISVTALCPRALARNVRLDATLASQTASRSRASFLNFRPRHSRISDRPWRPAVLLASSEQQQPDGDHPDVVLGAVCFAIYL
ncbi:uncharacterized protein KRP23_1556 [Phytophthora ramorum]|uniref:uncharacterized protein n=1 Tax=Phytophthora ramorum TaxID=164328 RepID=UPI00309A07F6|nr:hypothetical protein KRP23_1556 [Phytophthora ramorum]